jgi:hypothetical protein
MSLGGAEDRGSPLTAVMGLFPVTSNTQPVEFASGADTPQPRPCTAPAPISREGVRAGAWLLTGDDLPERRDHGRIELRPAAPLELHDSVGG